MARQRKLIDLLPNAPYIYLYDLKITEYQKLYYTPNGNILSINNLTAPVLLNQAMHSFSVLHFDTAVTALKQLLTINKDDPNALFYLGAAYYYQKNYAQALTTLNSLAGLTNNIFKQDALWYQALCLMAQQKNTEAKTLLQQVINTEGFYAEQAKKQLTEIK